MPNSIEQAPKFNFFGRCYAYSCGAIAGLALGRSLIEILNASSLKPCEPGDILNCPEYRLFFDTMTFLTVIMICCTPSWFITNRDIYPEELRFRPLYRTRTANRTVNQNAIAPDITISEIEAASESQTEITTSTSSLYSSV